MSRRGARACRSAWALAALLLASGCAGWPWPDAAPGSPTDAEPAQPPTAGAVRAFDPHRPVVALVLSGGAARGFAHIGVIRVLEQIGLEPDLIVGTSAGSVVGAAYAAGMSAAQIEAVAAGLDPTALADWVVPNLGQPLLRGELGFVRGQRLAQAIHTLVGGRPLQALPRRLAVVATDLHSGKPVVFTHGNTGLAVLASAAVPGIFVPPQINGRRYTDGQVSSPVPVAAALALGADTVIAVDATFPPEHADLASTVSVLFQILTIATQRIKAHELAQATVVIRPDIRSSAQLGWDDRAWVIAAGEQAARLALPQLMALRPGP